MNKDTTDFGYERVSKTSKASHVAEVFNSVARKYDVMNDVMSFGIHRLWKKYTLAQTGLHAGMRALDLAGGTGDVAVKLSEQVGIRGQVVLADINAAMLETGREKLLDRGLGNRIRFVQADAENLPFGDNSFDCIVIAFGLRNVTSKNSALASMYRVLRPGGRLLILEFSHPQMPGLSKIYDMYSFGLLPRMGKLIAGDADSYRYLAESIRMHPDQETLKSMMLDEQYQRCSYQNLSGGIVALHKGYKL